MEQKNYLATILAIGLIIVVIILALAKTKTGNGEEKRIVSVSGTSSLAVEPNKAEIYIKITTLEKTAHDSKNRNSQVSSSATKALKKEGIKDADIETSQFLISPKYEYEETAEASSRKSRQILVGYKVTNVLKVTTQNLEKVGKLIDAAVDNGANDIERITFGLTKQKENEIKKQVMIIASDDAKEKAVALITNLGASLGRIISISESSFFYQPFEISSREALFEKAVAAETEIGPQKIDVSATVSLVYEII